MQQETQTHTEIQMQTHTHRHNKKNSRENDENSIFFTGPHCYPSSNMFQKYGIPTSTKVKTRIMTPIYLILEYLRIEFSDYS